MQRIGFTLAVKVIKRDQGHLRLTFSFPCMMLSFSTCEVLSERYFQKRHKSKMTCLQSPRHLVCQIRFFTNIPKIATFVNWSERKTIFGEINFSSDSWDDPWVIHQEFILKILNRVIRYPWWIANYKMRISSLNSKRLKISYSGMMSGTPTGASSWIIPSSFETSLFLEFKRRLKLEYVERINCNRNRVISSRERSLVSA